MGNNLNVQQTQKNSVNDDTSPAWNCTQTLKVIVPFTIAPRTMEYLGKT